MFNDLPTNFTIAVNDEHIVDVVSIHYDVDQLEYHVRVEQRPAVRSAIITGRGSGSTLQEAFCDAADNWNSQLE